MGSEVDTDFSQVLPQLGSEGSANHEQLLMELVDLPHSLD